MICTRIYIIYLENGHKIINTFFYCFDTKPRKTIFMWVINKFFYFKIFILITAKRTKKTDTTIRFTASQQKES